MPALYYKDYFSVKTLHKFGVNPQKPLDLNASREEILSPFGKLSNEDKTYLQGKVTAALEDNGIVKTEATREHIEIAELDENVFDTPVQNLQENAMEMDAPTLDNEGKKL